VYILLSFECNDDGTNDDDEGNDEPGSADEAITAPPTLRAVRAWLFRQDRSKALLQEVNMVIEWLAEGWVVGGKERQERDVPSARERHEK